MQDPASAHPLRPKRAARLLGAVTMLCLALAGCADTAPGTGQEPPSSPAPVPSTGSPSSTAPAPGSSGAGSSGTGSSGAGSSGTGSSGTGSSGAGSSGAAAPEAATSLTVQLMADSDAVTDTWTLACDGATPVEGSGAPDPAAACAALADGGPDLLDEPGNGLSCTMQYGGPQRAAVTGSVDGQAVDTVFALNDGCQISRWEKLSSLLGPAATTQ